MAGDALTKAERLEKIEALLCRAPRGLTTAELAGQCQASQRTIQRDLVSLERLGVPLTQEGRRYGLLDAYQLPRVRFTLHEAAALFLAARLYAKGSDERNPHAGTALAKLAGVLPEPMGTQVHLTARHLINKAENQVFVDTLETLVKGWAKRRKVKIRYRSAKREREHEEILHPCYLEAANSFATYVIGFAESHQQIRTYKVERIIAAELLDEEFNPPADLDFAARLESSWGVIWSDGSDREVVLRFTPSVTRRVKETHWPGMQSLEDLPDGGCILTVRAASTLEMMNSIRSWGPDVEVLAPADLRRRIGEDLRRGAARYKDLTPLPSEGKGNP